METIDLTELTKAFLEIQMPRPPYALEALVVKSKFTQEQQYAQCTLELSIAYDNLRLAQLELEKTQIEIDEIEKNIGATRKDKITMEVKKIEKERTERAVLGAMREFEYLYSLWEKFPIKYTRKELDDAQETEYKMRIETQALHDKNSNGRISASNLEGLRLIGKNPFPSVDIGREVENRFLKNGDVKMMIAVATEEKAINGLPCLDGVNLPSGVSVKIFNCYGRKVDDAYNHIVETAIEDQANYLVTIEDDTFPPPDAIIKLYELVRSNKRVCAGAWYPKREESMQGVHIVIDNGERHSLNPDNKIHEVYTLAMGCSIYPMSVFKDIPYPFFKTTPNLSQDSFFSQLVREAGWKLLVDTSITCKHVDRKTGKVYELQKNEQKNTIPIPMQVPQELAKLLDAANGKKLIIEIGTALGGTLYQIIQVADPNAEIISIDLPGGKFGGEFGQPETSTMFSWLKEKQLMHILRGDSKSYQVVNKVREILNGRKADFIFIDGDHTYEGVKDDFEIYRQFAGDVVVFHDIANHPNHPDVGVKRFWDELEGDKTEHINDVNQGWAGVGILKIA